MSVPEIKDMDRLILQYLDKGKTIVSSNISRLTAPGDNYGSEMLLVDLTLANETNDREELSVVAKLTPESDFFREMFNIQVSFKAEKAFYDTLVPCWQEFQRHRGVRNVINDFAAFYGGRKNLKNEDDGLVDKDAVLILENLKVKGYTNVDRRVGFNFPTTIHLLSAIARFHAVPLALKLQDITTFEQKVKPFFACSNAPGPIPLIDEGLSKMVKALEAKGFSQRFTSKLYKSAKHFGVTPTDNFREPFSTISHRDLWVNNFMVKFEAAGEPIDSKIVDFQMYTYDTVAADIFFFLMSSVETEVLKTNLDRFLEHYHRVFTETLQSLGCDIAPFSYDKFIEEMVIGVERELVHICFMLCFVIHVKKVITTPGTVEAVPQFDQVELADGTLDKIRWIFEECDRRGWLNF